MTNPDRQGYIYGSNPNTRFEPSPPIRSHSKTAFKIFIFILLLLPTLYFIGLS